jgi:hypothetical protein
MAIFLIVLRTKKLLFSLCVRRSARNDMTRRRNIFSHSFYGIATSEHQGGYSSGSDNF